MFKIIRMVKSLKAILTDSSGTPLTVDDGALHVHLPGEVDTTNSTTTLLGAGETFTGVSREILEFALIFVNVTSDVASATNGLVIEGSYDDVTWFDADVYTIDAGANKTFSFQASPKYYRVKYINGSTIQTAFTIQSILKRTNAKPSSHRIADSISPQDDATLQKSVVTALNELTQQFVNINATRYNNLKVSISEYGDTPAIDAFARQRISNPFTIFDSKQLHDKQPLFWDEEIGGAATSVHEPVNANVLMTVTANANDYVIRQTKQRFNYQPGKSQLFIMTFQGSQNTGVIKRIGPFSGTGVNNLTPNNGMFIESNDTISVNICKDGVVTEKYEQADWNVDKMDGTGQSGITLDMDAGFILAIDMEWLGLGRVRFYAFIGGLPYVLHDASHANDPNFPTVYMSSPNLPLRYSIQSDGTGGGALRHVCSTVISEGGIEKTGILRVADTGSTHLNATAQNVTYAVVGIRQKADYIDITVIPEFISIINEVNDDFRWAISLNPTIAGTFTYIDIPLSSVQKAVGVTANTISDEGIVIASGYASVDTLSASAQLQTALKLGTTIAGVRDELVLTVTPLSAGADIQASLNFRELL